MCLARQRGARAHVLVLKRVKLRWQRVPWCQALHVFHNLCAPDSFEVLLARCTLALLRSLVSSEARAETAGARFESPARETALVATEAARVARAALFCYINRTQCTWQAHAFCCSSNAVVG